MLEKLFKLKERNTNVKTEVIAGITTVLSDTGANIENMINKSKGDNAYTLVDFTGDLADGVVEKITAITGVVRVRVI